MNISKIKDYAPKARRDFIAAVTERAAYYGLTKKNIEPATVQGDVVLITGRAFPLSIAEKRKLLEERVRKDGYDQVMEAIAYTWFNRLVAIRYMEIHVYLEHGFRVLSHPEGHGHLEILDHADELDLPGLDRKRVLELKLDGTRMRSSTGCCSWLNVMRYIRQCRSCSRKSEMRPSFFFPLICCTPTPSFADWWKASTRISGRRLRSSDGSTSFTSRRKRTRSSAKW